MISHTTPQRRLQISAGVILLAAGASVLGVPATAHAADSYVAISVGAANDNPPIRSIGGMGIGPDLDQARIASQSNCQQNGGNQCVFQAKAMNGCAAAAASDSGEVKGSSDMATQQAAESNAMSQLQTTQGAHVVLSGCSNGQVAPPPLHHHSRLRRCRGRQSRSRRSSAVGRPTSPTAVALRRNAPTRPTTSTALSRCPPTAAMTSRSFLRYRSSRIGTSPLPAITTPALRPPTTSERTELQAVDDLLRQY